ncbi:MAG: SAM-dependent methyltransferase [Tenuifilum sp.]|uniref:SAM-dependent methyltransferase n=1 Tax=Tenuifilum sp. TaxID=2760880 RepID=UPI0030ADC051
MAEVKGKLYLIPTPISGSEPENVLPQRVIDITRHLGYFVVEELRTARRYLSRIKVQKPIDELVFFELNEHSQPEAVEAMLTPLLQGYDVGLMSEAGVPAIADPGAILVAAAHRKGIQVIPLVGPSSILLTLVASGLNGQNFAFVGYLPVKPDERRKRIRMLEQRSRSEGQTQLFIEAPYRNIQLLKDLISVCSEQTTITIATEVTSTDEFIVTKTVREWKNIPLPDINKKNTVFALLA